MWFSKSIEDVLKEFNVDPSHGLLDEEAANRLRKYGPNKLTQRKKQSIFRLFISHLNDWLIIVLFAAVIITVIMGEYIDAVIIITVIIINAVLGVVQEIKAGNAIEALNKMTYPQSQVKRNGENLKIDSDKVVPGDILILDPGRFISADIRLIETSHLQIDESVLTGESVPAHKNATLVHDKNTTALGDLKNSAFMSTLVTYGRGAGVVAGTGMNTEIGKIAGIINEEIKSKTPLQIRLDSLGKKLGFIAVGICVFIFIIAAFQGRNLAEMFLTSVSLAVAAIPEGLAAIIAVVLSIGVTKMSKKNAIIKKLPAVETLGSVNIICTDKTGTLTQNKMTVTNYFNLSGEGSVERNNKNSAGEDAVLLSKAMILASDATSHNGFATGDPTEIALLLFGDDLGVDRNELNRKNKRIGELPFDSDRKLMSVLIKENGRYIVYTKGAIVNILKICNRVLLNGKIIPLTDELRQRFHDATIAMTDKALRTLGAACKSADNEIEFSEMEKDLILIGIVGMFDPPRLEAKSAIQKAKNAGILSVMITGDHKNTAFAIAHELGIAENIDQAITGKEMDALSDLKFNEMVNRYRVFARVTPKDKVKIVNAFRSQGNIVSMTVDGVNDAPSLIAADIGVAMGISGTDVAKQASDMVLTDDNFATIVTAIEQGRNIYNNIKNAVLFLLICNLGEVIAMLIPLLIGWNAPFIATQLLWINLITDSLPAIALGMDPGNPDVMKNKPRGIKENFFSGGAGLHIVLGGILIGGLTITAFICGYIQDGYSPFDRDVPHATFEYAGTMAFIVLILCQLFYALASRNHSKSIFQIGVFSNKYLIGAILLGIFLQSVVICIPEIRRAFHLQMPDMQGWQIVISLSLIPLFLNEIVKIFIRRKRSKTGLKS